MPAKKSTPAASTISVLGKGDPGFGLAGFEPGDYSLRLRVTNEVAHESRDVREPFVVVP